MGAGPKAGGSLAMARCLACGLQPARPPAPGPQAGGSRARGHRHGMRPSASQGADLAKLEHHSSKLVLPISERIVVLAEVEQGISNLVAHL